MPRIKKHPNLPTKFSCKTATTAIPTEWGFKIGDRVRYEAAIWEGVVCGADDVDKLYPQLIVFAPETFGMGVNGVGTYTSHYKNWRKI